MFTSSTFNFIPACGGYWLFVIELDPELFHGPVNQSTINVVSEVINSQQNFSDYNKFICLSLLTRTRSIASWIYDCLGGGGGTSA